MLLNWFLIVAINKAWTTITNYVKWNVRVDSIFQKRPSIAATRRFGNRAGTVLPTNNSNLFVIMFSTDSFHCCARDRHNRGMRSRFIVCRFGSRIRARRHEGGNGRTMAREDAEHHGNGPIARASRNQLNGERRTSER